MRPKQATITIWPSIQADLLLDSDGLDIVYPSAMQGPTPPPNWRTGPCAVWSYKPADESPASLEAIADYTLKMARHYPEGIRTNRLESMGFQFVAEAASYSPEATYEPNSIKLRAVAELMGMRPLTPAEDAAYQGCACNPLITEVLVYAAIEADLVVDDVTLQLHWYGPDDEIASWSWGIDRTRYERELMAALVIAMSCQPDGIQEHELINLGWDNLT